MSSFMKPIMGNFLAVMYACLALECMVLILEVDFILNIGSF